MTRPRKEETICTKQFGFEVTVLTQNKQILFSCTPEVSRRLCALCPMDSTLFSKHRNMWFYQVFSTRLSGFMIKIVCDRWIESQKFRDFWGNIDILNFVEQQSSITRGFKFLWIHKILTTYCFFFYGSIKFWWTCDQNFMDPYNFGGNEIKILWIHKILTVYWSFFMDPQNFECILFIFLWIHKILEIQDLILYWSIINSIPVLKQEIHVVVSAFLWRLAVLPIVAPWTSTEKPSISAIK